MRSQAYVKPLLSVAAASLAFIAGDNFRGPLTVHAAVAPFAADTHPDEEAAIRKLITEVDAKGSTGHSTTDFIFWSGAYKKPIIGHNDPKEYKTGEGSIPDRVPSTRRLVTVPNRIVVSDSKDMAYEYSTFNMQFSTKEGKQIKFGGAGLRVWQKVNGEWKQAASFQRDYDE